MRGIFLALLLALSALASPASAQSTATRTVGGFLSQLNCPPGVTTCFVQALAPIAGTQVNVTITSATALTVPSNAVLAVVQAQGTNNTGGVCAFWRDDGTAPTTTAGQALPANTSLQYRVPNLGVIKFIQASSATCTISVAYYG